MRVCVHECMYVCLSVGSMHACIHMGMDQYGYVGMEVCGMRVSWEGVGQRATMSLYDSGKPVKRATQRQTQSLATKLKDST